MMKMNNRGAGPLAGMRAAFLAAGLLTAVLLAGCASSETGSGADAQEPVTYMERIPENDPIHTGNAQAGSTAGEEASAAASSAVSSGSWYEGKTVSIIGDSISTYSGIIPDDYNQNYPADDVDDVSKTWWRQVLDGGNMTLGSNASFSGGLTTGDTFDMSGMIATGARRMQDLSVDSHTGESVDPEIIFVMTGTNDYIQDREVGTYTPGQTSAKEGEIDVFADAYDFLLTKLDAMYPGAQIVCLTCIPTGYVNASGKSVDEYNEQIRQVAIGHGAALIDTYNCGLDPAAELYDGVHPNAAGMEKISSFILSKLASAPSAAAGMKEVN